ncbi:MAG: thiamine pyrophosphate-binding protein [Candidatus Methylomirabilota bacterium]|nr:MAG: thiamine pyrophosphate-binding protein [candidate division NC10 bacterium]
MELCRYLFGRFKEAGVRHVFGLPGDFFLPFFRALEEEPGIEPVILTHEPSVGYAADAYARVRGLGVAAVTWGAGALNMVNATAQAYAERSPVLVLSGAPEIAHRDPDALLHHRVKNFASQLRVYREVTGAAVALDDPAHAIAEADRVIDSVLRTKRPGYIEIPRDLIRADVPVPARRTSDIRLKDERAANEALAEVLARIRVAEQPAIYAGAEIRRFRLHDKLVTLAERYGLPVATSLDGKAVFPEQHPLFAGNYLGEIGSPRARKVLESADCVLMLGARMTDVNTGLYTARFDRRRVISAVHEGVTVSYHRFPDVSLEDLMDALLALPEPPRRVEPLPPPPLPEPTPTETLTPDAIIAVLNRVAAGRPVFYAADVGDALFASVELETDMFLGPGYYSSMGFAVPAAIGAGLAEPGRRPIALVGDGAFLMTGLDLVTCVRLGLPAIVILFNNRSHGMLAAMDEPARSYELPTPDYVRLAESLGGRAFRVGTPEELERVLVEALEDVTATILIETVIPPGTYSAPMQRLGAVVHRMKNRSALG